MIINLILSKKLDLVFMKNKDKNDLYYFLKKDKIMKLIYL